MYLFVLFSHQYKAGPPAPVSHISVQVWICLHQETSPLGKKINFNSYEKIRN